MSSKLLGGDDGIVSDKGGGVYARHPASQLKYNTSWANGTDTQARLRIAAPGKSASEVTKRLPSEVQAYAKAAMENGYIDFLLQTTSESATEKVQTVEFLSDNYAAYFFGQRPPVYQYSGVLYNTRQDDWWVGFWFLYSMVLRGTKLAELGLLCRLQYNSQIVTGALLDFSSNYSADLQMAVNFRFSMLVKDVAIVPSVDGSAARAPTQVKVSDLTSTKALDPLVLTTETPSTTVSYVQTLDSPKATLQGSANPE